MRKFIFAFILIGVILLPGCTNRQLNITQEQKSVPENLETNNSVSFKLVNYILTQMTLETPHNMMLENARWNSSVLTFYSKIRENSTLQNIRDAVGEWNKETVVKLIEVDKSSKADFIIRYPISGEFKETPGLKFILGEAKLYTNYTGIFNLISSAELLYTLGSSECENKVITIHELGHIVGLDHVTDAESVMFPTVDCNGKITEKMKRTLENLYSIEALPDLYFGDIDAEKTGKYLILNFTVWNSGLIKSENVSLKININNNMTKVYEIPSIEPGRGWMIPDVIPVIQDFDSFTLTIDPLNIQEELNRDNNIAVLKS